MTEDRSAYAAFMARRQTEDWGPAGALRKLVVGEYVLVNWIPPGTQKRGKVVDFDRGKPIVRMDHNQCSITIETPEQILWNRNLHVKRK